MKHPAQITLMKTVARKVQAIAPEVADLILYICSLDIPPQASSLSPTLERKPTLSFPPAVHPSCSLGRDTPVTATASPSTARDRAGAPPPQLLRPLQRADPGLLEQDSKQTRFPFVIVLSPPQTWPHPLPSSFPHNLSWKVWQALWAARVIY